jgi:retinol dehydrogenase 12
LPTPLFRPKSTMPANLPTTSSLLQGRMALVTGANTGIGFVTARELCAQGAQVFIACRTAATGQAAVQAIKTAVPGAQIELLSLDLANFASIRQCAAGFFARGLPLHILVNNAGLAAAKGMTASGFEIAFGTNHLGTFLLTQLLLDRIKASGPARIVTVASRAHYRAKGLDFSALTKARAGGTGIAEYSVSKLANVLFSAELARRLAGSGVTTYSLHPGVVATDVWREVPAPIRWLLKLRMLSAEEGARTTLYCATSPNCAAQTGLYYDKCQPKTPSSLAQDAALAAELWRRSEAWVAGGK